MRWPLACALLCFLVSHASAAPLPRGAREPQILFTSKEDGFYHLFLMEPDGSRRQRLTKTKANHLFPAWSPDGKQIVYSLKQSDDLHLFVMREDGTGAKQLTRGQVTDRGAAWSPDGKKIAFTRAPRGSFNHEIYVVDVKSGKFTNLTRNGAYDADPAWSPDGKNIIFASNRAGDGFRPHVMNADGSNVKSITNRGNRFGFVYPTWSPDGKKVIYADQSDKGTELFISNPDGSGRKQLTTLGGYNSYAAWHPKEQRILLQHHTTSNGDGSLYTVDLKTGKAERVKAEVAAPDEGGRPSYQPK